MNKYIKLSLLIFIFFTIVYGYYIFYIKNQKFIEINGIENFKPNDLNDKISENNYFLYYPSDIRVSQDYTLIKQVDKNGNIINEYKVYDDKFRRINIDQKIADKNNLYLTPFGEAVLENWFYMFNLSSNTFSKVDLDYFKYDVGVHSMKHQGYDILFSTVATHTTGDQQYNEEKNSFKISISNFTTKKSYETSYDYIPSISGGLTTFNDKIVYSTIQNIENKSGIVFIDESGKFDFLSFDGIEKEEVSIIFSDNDSLYLISSNNKFIKVNKNLDYEIFDFGKNFKDYFYDSSLLLDTNSILISLKNRSFSKSSTTILGVLTFNEDIKFNIIDNIGNKNNVLYNIKYMDKNGNIFIIEDIERNKGNIIILDYNNNFKIKNIIPVSYPHLLDLVIEVK